VKTDMKRDGSKGHNEGGRGMMRGERSAWKVKGVMREGGVGGGRGAECNAKSRQGMLIVYISQNIPCPLIVHCPKTEEL
jgi:hypothetical protein